MSGCQCITDTGIQALARSCPHLRSVNVSSCYELTDEALCAMAACHRLRAVNTCGCERLTDQGLCSLANGARCASIFGAPAHVIQVKIVVVKGAPQLLGILMSGSIGVAVHVWLKLLRYTLEGRIK